MKQMTAIVTGAAGGIGLETVRLLTSSGIHVLMIDHNADTLEVAAGEFSDGAVAYLAVSVTDGNAVADAVSKFGDIQGHIDIMVNVAGGAGPDRAYQIESVTDEIWDHVIDLNLKSTFAFCRAVVPYMREQKYGRIVNLSSILAAGEKGPPTTVAARLPYATAKAAIDGLTRQLAKDLAADGITVNSVVPGLILAGEGTRIRQRFEALPDEEQKRMVEGYPVGRPGAATEVAAAIAFLVSEQSGYITGVHLAVDGGYL